MCSVQRKYLLSGYNQIPAKWLALEEKRVTKLTNSVEIVGRVVRLYLLQTATITTRTGVVREKL